MAVPYQTPHIRCRCGGRGMLPRNGGFQFTDKHLELGVVQRYRICEACKKKMHTTEIESGELADLRRRAFMFERTVGSAAK